jgi:hypothetical protein
VALIRACLRVAAGTPAVIRAHAFPVGSRPGADPTATLASVDFGEGRCGIYDCARPHSRVRSGRLLIRGGRGEIDGNQVVRLIPFAHTGTGTESPLASRPATPHLITTTYLRRHTDPDQITLGGEVLWRNPWPGERWNDAELASAETLTRLTGWLRGDGPGPYPLAEALYDARLGLAIAEAPDREHAVDVV